MEGSVERRIFATLVVSSLISLLGCLDENSRGSGSTGTQQSDSQTRNTQDSPSGNQPVGGTESLYIENLDQETYRITISVERQDNGSFETVASGQYEVAALTGLEFQNLGRNGETYRVSFSPNSGVEKERIWEPYDCEWNESPEASHDAAIRIEGGEFSFTQDTCDFFPVGQQDIEYIPSSSKQANNTG